MAILDVTASPYNATGDGTTNDQPAIAAAITAASAGDTLYFPAGRYRTTSQIAFGSKLLVALGDGPDVTTIAGEVGATTAIVHLGSASHSTISGISIDGSNGTGTGSYGVQGTGSYQFVDDAVLINLRNGLLLAGTSITGTVWMRNVFFASIPGRTSAGMMFLYECATPQINGASSIGTLFCVAGASGSFSMSGASFYQPFAIGSAVLAGSNEPFKTAVGSQPAIVSVGTLIAESEAGAEDLAGNDVQLKAFDAYLSDYTATSSGAFAPEVASSQTVAGIFRDAPNGDLRLTDAAKAKPAIAAFSAAFAARSSHVATVLGITLDAPTDLVGGSKPRPNFNGGFQ